jgi:hypothetical protein
VADPTWAPTLAQVGSYIPARTAAVDTTSDTLTGTFTAATVPTGGQVGTLISDACAWIILRTGAIITTPTGPVVDALTRMATATAAVRTAGMVELSYPIRPDSINTAQALLAQAETMLGELVQANETAGAVDASIPALLPTGQFPAPPRWGDDLLI